VFGNDRVILYMGEDDGTGDAAEAWDEERG